MNSTTTNSSKVSDETAKRNRELVLSKGFRAVSSALGLCTYVNGQDHQLSVGLVNGSAVTLEVKGSSKALDGWPQMFVTAHTPQGNMWQAATSGDRWVGTKLDKAETPVDIVIACVEFLNGLEAKDAKLS